jgi:RNA polymerase sigma-70 factor (ECF subfamily)
LDQRDLTALAIAFQKGDERSFRVLVDSLSRTMMAMAYRYTSDWEWSRDLTQDTWIKIHQRIQQWDPDRSFSAWLHTIHRNGCLDHIRKGWVRLESTPGDEVVNRLAGTAAVESEVELERRDFHDRLKTAVGQLSESQRQVFLRVDLEHQDQQDVAKALGIKFGTLRTTLHFARKRLATVLRQMEKST